MTVCGKRPETPGSFTDCPGGWGQCPCGKEVREAIKAGELIAGQTIETPTPVSGTAVLERALAHGVA